MKLGRIDGKVWATIKDENLRGLCLYILQPIDEFGEDTGSSVVAVDTLGVREGDTVYWVQSTEASFVREAPIPCEVSIVGLVDRLDLGPAYLASPKRENP